MKGSFNEKSLLVYSELVTEKMDMDFAEGEVYDFTRCMRADGSFYGTSGRCRQGSPAGPKEEVERTGRQRTPSERSARSKDDDVSFPSNSKKPGLRDSSVAELRKAMKHHREQMMLHGNKIAELDNAGKGVPKSLRDKFNKAKESYNTHRKAINDATGIMKRPVMQEAREAGRAAEKKKQEERAIQRGKEFVARAGTRDRSLTPKEQAEIDAKLGRTPGPSKLAEGIQREQMRAERAARTAKKPEAPLRGQNLANKMMDHINISNRVAANHGGAIRTKAAKEEHAAELKKAGVPDRATLTAALKAQRDEAKGGK